MKEYVWNLYECDRTRVPLSGYYVDLVEYTLNDTGFRESDNYLEENHFTDMATASAYWVNNKKANYILYNEIEERENNDTLNF
jgi:hypothetical protein